MTMKKNFYLALPIAFALVFTACSDNDSSDSGLTSNTAPVAVATSGVYEHTITGILVTLKGSDSYDADHDLLTYSWSLVGKPNGSSATLSRTTEAKPTFTTDLVGHYSIELVVNDGTVDSAAVTTTVTAGSNAKPVANAGWPIQTAPALSIHSSGLVFLDGSKSTDADKDPLTYKWDFESKPADSTAAFNDATISHPEFIADKPGFYNVTLIVNDGNIDSDTVKVTIMSSLINVPPIAQAGLDRHVKVDTITPVDLNGSDSYDADHDSLTYNWQFKSMPQGSSSIINGADTATPSFIADLPGDYVVTLVVGDTINLSRDNVTITAVVTSDPSTPVAHAGTDHQYVHQGTTITIDGSGSSDADGDTLTYNWHIKSQPTSSTATLDVTVADKPTLIIDVNGDYVIELTVNDGWLDSTPVSVRVTTKMTDQTLRMIVEDYKNDHGNPILANYIKNADTSEITDMHSLFYNDHTFDLDISGWNTSKLISMELTFGNANAFDQNISMWDVSSVTNHLDFDVNTSASWEASEKPSFP